MEKRGISHVLTKEPGTPYIEECKAIRELLLNPKNNLCDAAELLLFLADRAQHVGGLISPSLSAGKHVICDRYADSTRVYQCSRGFGRDKIDMLLEFATNGVMPNITFILDVPVDVGLERAKAKSIYKEGDRMENAGLQFHEDVRHGFLKLAESIAEQHRFYIIDAAPPKTIEQIHGEVVKEISKKIWVNGLMEEDNG
jgi:dTMP kinase